MIQLVAPDHVLEAVRNAPDFIFDVDLTLTERQKPLGDALAQVLHQSGRRIGICTSRAENELDEIFQSADPRFSRAQLVRGPVVLEDGCVLVRPGAAQPELLVSLQAAAAVNLLTTKIASKLSEERFDGPWRQLEGLPRPYVQVPTQYNYRTSLSIWQHAPEGIETLKTQLHHTMSWCRSLVAESKLEDFVHLTEIGDGTLRISVPGRNKGVALQELHTQGTVDLSKAVYFCDGANDIPAAKVIRSLGGCVVAVDTHCPSLLEHASYVTPAKGPDGLRRFLAGALRG